MTCQDKRRYPSSAAARRAVDNIRKRGARRSEVKPAREYLCPHCKGWHLTSERR